jgi:hypothetical protein
MLNRMLAGVTLATFATIAAQAGTLQNGTWTASCPSPGDAPQFSSKSPEAYNTSAKAAQDWQQKAKDYADCMNKEAKSDQQAVVEGANSAITKINDSLNGLQKQSQEAVDKLKKKKGS